MRFLWSFDLLKRVVLYRVLNFKHSESAYVLKLVHRCVSVPGLVCERGVRDCGLILARDLAGFSFRRIIFERRYFFCTLNLWRGTIKTLFRFQIQVA